MTLATLAEYVCTKVGQGDAASAEACRLFLQRRYRMLWDHALWAESLAMATVTVPPGSEVCPLPVPCELVVAVRRGALPVPMLELTTLMRYEAGAYENTGPLLSFFLEDATTLRIAGARSGEQYTLLLKRPCADLTGEETEPELRGCAHALLAFATADMLERQRQYAKAQLKLKEGHELLAALLERETNQTAREQRLVPVLIHAASEQTW